jgi:HemY protein
MIRVLAYFIIVFLVAAGAAWLADRPGEVVLHWQGYEIRTSLFLAAAGVLAVMAALAIVWALLRAIFRAPRALSSHLGRRRRDRGYRALNAGIIAVGAGDARAARKAAEESQALLGPQPLVLLLAAQAAQLSGDADGARGAFQALAARPETRLLGLHGLFVEAERHDQHEAARHFAEEAAGATPRVAWAGTAVFDYAARDGDWRTAVAALDANVQAGIVDATEAPHVRAALLTARAMELEASEPDRARLLALDALKLQPGLAPAAGVAARLYSRNADIRRASKVLEAAWKVEPNPEIADAYATVRPGDSVLDRLKRMRKLADTRANHPEGAMAIARAAIDAGDWTAARGALEGLAKAPTERVCLLMAEIEDRENNDQGRVRGWLTRALGAPRDPAWVADGQVLERWLPVSPVTGRVGAVAWAVPPLAPQRSLPPLEAGHFDEPLAAVDNFAVPRLESRPTAPVPPEPDMVPEEDEAPVIEATPVVAVPAPMQPPMAAPLTAAPPSVPAPSAPAIATPAPAPLVPPPQAQPAPAPAGASVQPDANAAPASPPAPEPPPAAAVPAAAPEAPPVPKGTWMRTAPPSSPPAPPRGEARPAAGPERPSPPAAASAAPGGPAGPGEPPSLAGDAPFVPHAPDDPGPLPPDPDEDGARRRFRLF